MLLRRWTITTTTLLLSIASAYTSAATTVADCKKLTDNFARLNCYDQQGLSTENTKVVPPAPQTAAPVVSPSSPQTTVTAVNNQDDLPMAKNKPDDEPKDITGKVTTYERNKYEKLIVTLENREVWRQTDSGYLDIKVGDVVVITEASFSSFLMSNGRDKRKIRVKRVE